MKKVVETYPDDVAIYFFHNPLGFHPNAMPAAKASTAAQKQGKFWEMHDKLFENQRKLNDDNYMKWAREMGLDMEKFKKDLEDKDIETEIKRQQAVVVALGARGTPGFFINGESLRGAQPFDKFKALIDTKLAATNKVMKDKGLSSAEAWQEVAKTAANGTNFVKWVVKGEKPPANAAKRPDRKKKKAPVDKTVWKVTVDDDDATKGAKKPLVNIVEFSEFQ